MQVELIKPFPFESLPRIWSWISTFREKVADDFGPKTMDEFISHMRSVWDRQKSWAIFNDGELGGLITFERVTPWLGTAHVLLKPDFQGKGIAVQACRQAVGEMFTQEGVGKLEFRVLGGNLAVGSLLITIGAKREGTQEQHTLRAGEPADVWIYGLTKEHFVAMPARRLYSRDNTNLQRARRTQDVISTSGNAASQHQEYVEPIVGPQLRDQQHRGDAIPPNAANGGRPDELRHPIDAESDGAIGTNP
jgi:RimJ/RimL family protein N-acetyltransferase